MVRNAYDERFNKICPIPRMPLTTEALSPYIGPHILSEAADVLRAA